MLFISEFSFIINFLSIFCFSWHRSLRRTLHRSVHYSSTFDPFVLTNKSAILQVDQYNRKFYQQGTFFLVF